MSTAIVDLPCINICTKRFSPVINITDLNYHSKHHQQLFCHNSDFIKTEFYKKFTIKLCEDQPMIKLYKC